MERVKEMNKEKKITQPNALYLINENGIEDSPAIRTRNENNDVSRAGGPYINTEQEAGGRIMT